MITVTGNYTYPEQTPSTLRAISDDTDNFVLIPFALCTRMRACPSREGSASAHPTDKPNGVACALAAPDLRAPCTTLGVEPMSMTSAEFARFVRSETEAVARITQAAGIKSQEPASAHAQPGNRADRLLAALPPAYSCSCGPFHALCERDASSGCFC